MEYHGNGYGAVTFAWRRPAGNPEHRNLFDMPRLEPVKDVTMIRLYLSGACLETSVRDRERAFNKIFPNSPALKRFGHFSWLLS